MLWSPTLSSGFRVLCTRYILHFYRSAYNNAQTKHAIYSIMSADNSVSRYKLLEELTSHLNEYPQAKDSAVKEGGISLLLNLRRIEEEKEEVQGILREALTLLGHVDPLPKRGIRILSMDGGGTRGVLIIEMLRKLEELTGKRVHELFDFICGVSTGAILACLLGPHKKSLEECSVLYKELSAKIFKQSPFWGTSSLVWYHAYYDTQLWENLLREYIGEISLGRTSRDPCCPKLALISTLVNQEQLLAYVFRNYNFPCGTQSEYVGSMKHQLWEAVRASAAAPSYFEEFQTGEFLHQDGGILVNNPTAVAIHEARHLWPNYPLQCILSLGTGKHQNPGMLLPYLTHTKMFKKPEVSAQKLIAAGNDVASTSACSSSSTTVSSSWKTKFMKIICSATDTEGVHTMLRDFLPEDVYFRFNPHLTDLTNMDEIRPEKISQLQRDAASYINHNEEAFHSAASALLAPKSLQQKCVDWFKVHYSEGFPSLLSELHVRWVRRRFGD